ncbi:MAG: hypothetical protein K6F44_02930 [Lachnospiraceae bacterium]|nr:hypothetical protein [Lachnospiraceae bacterium]
MAYSSEKDEKRQDSVFRIKAESSKDKKARRRNERRMEDVVGKVTDDVGLGSIDDDKEAADRRAEATALTKRDRTAITVAYKFFRREKTFESEIREAKARRFDRDEAVRKAKIEKNKAEEKRRAELVFGFVKRWQFGFHEMIGQFSLSKDDEMRQKIERIEKDLLTVANSISLPYWVDTNPEKDVLFMPAHPKKAEEKLPPKPAGEAPKPTEEPKEEESVPTAVQEEETPKEEKPKVEKPKEEESVPTGVKEEEIPKVEKPKEEESVPTEVQEEETPKETVGLPPKPVNEAPKPATEAPKPATEAPKPATEAPKPATEAPKPATEAPKPATEAPKPAAVKPAAVPGAIPKPAPSKTANGAYEKTEAALARIVGELEHFVIAAGNEKDARTAKVWLDRVGAAIRTINSEIGNVKNLVESKRENVIIGTLIDRAMRRTLPDGYVPDYTVPGARTDTEKSGGGAGKKPVNSMEHLLNIKYAEEKHVEYPKDSFRALAEDAFGKDPIVDVLMESYKNDDFVNKFINESGVLYSYFKNAKMRKRMKEADEIYALIIQKLVGSVKELSSFIRPYDNSLYFFVVNLGENLLKGTCVLHEESLGMLESEAKARGAESAQDVYNAVETNEGTQAGQEEDNLFAAGNEKMLNEGRKIEDRFYSTEEIGKIISEYHIVDGVDLSDKCIKKLRAIESFDAVMGFARNMTTLRFTVEKGVYGKGLYQSIVLTDVVAVGGPVPSFDSSGNVTDEPNAKKEKKEESTEKAKDEKPVEDKEEGTEKAKDDTSVEKKKKSTEKAKDEKPVEKKEEDTKEAKDEKPEEKKETKEEKKADIAEILPNVSEEISAQIGKMTLEEMKTRFLKVDEGKGVSEARKPIFAKFLIYKFSTVQKEDEKKALAESVSADPEVMDIIKKYYPKAVKEENKKLTLNIKGFEKEKWNVVKKETKPMSVRNSYWNRLGAPFAEVTDSARNKQESRFSNVDLILPLRIFNGHKNTMIHIRRTPIGTGK